MRTESVLARVADIQEAILILVLLVDSTHQLRCWWQNLIDENEDSFLWCKLDALSDHVDELAYCEIRRHQVLLLINGRDIRLICFLADDRNPIWVLLPDALRFCLSLLEGVLILELGPHDDDSLGCKSD